MIVLSSFSSSVFLVSRILWSAVKSAIMKHINLILFEILFNQEAKTMNLSSLTIILKTLEVKNMIITGYLSYIWRSFSASVGSSCHFADYYLDLTILPGLTNTLLVFDVVQDHVKNRNWTIRNRFQTLFVMINKKISKFKILWTDALWLRLIIE